MAEVYMKEEMVESLVSKYGSIQSLKRVVTIGGLSRVFVLPVLNQNPSWYYSDYDTMRYNWAENFEDDDISEEEALKILESFGLDKNMLYVRLTI